MVRHETVIAWAGGVVPHDSVYDDIHDAAKHPLPGVFFLYQDHFSNSDNNGGIKIRNTVISNTEVLRCSEHLGMTQAQAQAFSG